MINYDLIIKVYAITASILPIVLTGISKVRKQNKFNDKANFEFLKDSYDLNLSSEMKQFSIDSYEDELFYKVTKIRAQGAKRIALINLHKRVNHLFGWSQIKELYQYIDFTDNKTDIKINKFEERFLLFSFYSGLIMLALGLVLAYITAIKLGILALPFVIVGVFLVFYGLTFMRPKFALDNAKKIKGILKSSDCV